jgi:hypothetical protein
VIYYGIRITSIYVRIPTQIENPFGIAHFSYRRTFKVLENLPWDQEGFFFYFFLTGKVFKIDVQKFVVECVVFQ